MPMKKLSMTIFLLIIAIIITLTIGLYWYTHTQKANIEASFPPLGEMIDIGGYKLHLVHVPAPEAPELPPLVFIHGASGNLQDTMGGFRAAFEGRAELLFVDRPGHGWSDRGGPENAFPDGQARAIAKAMQAKGMNKAIIVGHSFGGAITASFALEHPEMVAGLVFLAPATHPWPGGIAWYYPIARHPVTGPIFANLLAVPAGLSRIESGTKCVFAPNTRPDDYITQTAPQLVLRPKTFRANATDVANLYDYVVKTAPRYPEISAPTIIVTGDKDTVVLPNIHSRGLAQDIDGAELVWIKNLGHKPDYIARDISIAAIENVAGADHDLHAMARQLEEAIADDNYLCPTED